MNKAKAYAANVKPIAQGQAQRITREAEAYKQQVILRAKGDVAGFNALLTPYKRAPEVTRERLYLDAVQSVLSNTSKVLLDTKGSQNLTYLPLDQILSRSRAATSDTQKGRELASNTLDYANSPRQDSSLIEQRLGRNSYTGRSN